MKTKYIAHEYKLVKLRECPVRCLCDNPKSASAYWRRHVTSHPLYNPDVECVVVVMLNIRRKIIGHHLVSTGTLDTCLVGAREVFRLAIVQNAAAILLMHNHPSGDPLPSDSDVKVTRDMVRAGALLKIELCDHVIVGSGRKYASLKELGYL